MEAARLGKIKQTINNFEEFPIQYHDELIEGITLKHAVQHMCHYSDQSLFLTLHEKLCNSKHTFEPSTAQQLPSYFKNDFEKCTETSFEQKVPLSQTFKIKFTHPPPQKKFMVPDNLSQEEEYTVFFCSPNKVIRRSFNQGRGYPYADSFYTEQLMTLE